ncbi:histone H1 [Stegastes partitus]|uniref:Histone H1-like n=1 Tax=Stegastes partitus TaxID=144197 RepID=A0A3B4Z7C1_9TELE|nr:PREDICTED: histone H1-like [Stegastes partitus]
MSAPAIALPAPGPAKSPKKTSKAKKGPTVSSLILKAVAASSERTGITLPALKKVLAARGYDVNKNKVRLAGAIRRLVAKKVLVRSKGSLKLNKKPPTPRKKKVVKKKKATTKKAKKPSAKKAAAKKSPKKKKAKKSPKKKAAKKPKAPKKVKRRVAKAPKAAKAAKTRTRAAAKK